jgi:hypothetical protein
MFNHDMLGRIYGFPVVDVAGTAVLGYGASKVTGITPLVTVPVLFGIGHAVHWAMGTETQLNKPSNESQLQEDAHFELEKIKHELKTNHSIHASVAFAGSYSVINKVLGFGNIISLFGSTVISGVTLAVMTVNEENSK